MTATFDEVEPGACVVPVPALNGSCRPRARTGSSGAAGLGLENFDGETLLMTGHLKTVSVEDLIDAEGRRNPSPELLSPVELTWFDRQAIFVGSEIADLAFAAATGYRATLDTRLDVTLVANYPDPFNCTTTVTFAFEAEDRVSLAIYDVVGRRVRTLGDLHPLTADAA